jgi:hypothetical protein
MLALRKSLTRTNSFKHKVKGALHLPSLTNKVVAPSTVPAQHQHPHLHQLPHPHSPRRRSSPHFSPRGSVNKIDHNVYLNQLSQNKKRNWCMLYCGGSQPIKHVLEKTSATYGVHLKCENFDW